MIKLNPYNLNSYYSREDFVRDFTEFQKKLETALQTEDEKFNSGGKSFPMAYSSNIYWFIVLLADLYYLNGVANNYGELGQCYWDVDINFHSLDLSKHYTGWPLKKRILESLLGLDCVDDIDEKKLRRPLSKYIKKAKQIVSNATQMRGGKNIAVVQGGFEVDLLKHYLPEAHYTYPKKQILESIPNTSNYIVAPDSHLDMFLREELSGSVASWAINMFDCYQSSVVYRILDAQWKVVDLFTKDRPKALFYSIGAIDTLDHIIAWVAEQMDIPVFYFQHSGGISAFKYNPFNKYIEDNNRVKKINIDYKTFGSIDIWNRSKKKWKRFDPPYRDLYCPTAPTFNAYKDLFLGKSDKEYLANHLHIMNMSAVFDRRLDINIHPVEAAHSYAHFERLIKKHNFKNIRIINRDARDIAGRYDDVIVDYKVSSLLMYLRNMPCTLQYQDRPSMRLLHLGYEKKRKSNPGEMMTEFIRSKI